MTKPLKPPHGIYVPSWIVYHREMSPQVKETLIEILALTWTRKDHCTPVISYSILSNLTGKAIRTLFGHIADLRDTYSVLRIHYTEEGLYYVAFSDWLFEYEKKKHKQRKPPRAGPVEGKPDCEVSQLPVNEEEDSESLNLRENLLLNNELQSSAIVKPDKNAENCTPDVPNTLSEDLQETLREAGVFEKLLCQVAQSGRPEEDLRALLRWCQEDQPDCPAPLFMGRLRMEATAPKKYGQPPCPVCGRYGEHAPDCSRRYLTGEFAEFLEH